MKEFLKLTKQKTIIYNLVKIQTRASMMMKNSRIKNINKIPTIKIK